MLNHLAVSFRVTGGNGGSGGSGGKSGKVVVRGGYVVVDVAPVGCSGARWSCDSM